MGLQACDDSADDSDGEHPEIHQVGGITVLPDNANAKTKPDKDECRRERDADGESVRGVVRFHSSPRLMEA
jgi:hypothetical protein